MGYAKLLLASLLVAVLVGAGCSSSSDQFFVRNDGADMPVFDEGDLDADTWVLMLHGGPGPTGLIYHWCDTFTRLEEQHAMVYWEQRGSGLSQGNAAASTYTIEQFVEDADAVVKTLETRHGPTRLVFLSHSFGGSIAASYLLDGERRSRISAWIDVAGARHLNESFGYTRDWMTELGAEALADPEVNDENRERWQRALAWFEDHPSYPSGMEDALEYAEHLMLAYDQLDYDLEEALRLFNEGISEHGVRDTFFESFNPFYHLYNAGRAVELFDLASVSVESSALAVVDIPALIMAGAFDVSIPSALSEGTFNGLGTAPEQKEFVIFESSGHQPMWEEPDLFYDHVSEFLSRF
jgi:pimeloyl-ACP methyl ester carboxylesterase